MPPEAYATLLRRYACRHGPVPVAHVRHWIRAWIRSLNNERTIPMPITEPLPDLTDRDKRWLVHVFAALRNGIDDELDYDSIPFHDASLVVDQDRRDHLYNYVYSALTWCMEQTHAEEAARVAADL
jgi:hypothetical protein